jgi:hypothetical protein
LIKPEIEFGNIDLTDSRKPVKLPGLNVIFLVSNEANFDRFDFLILFRRVLISVSGKNVRSSLLKRSLSSDQEMVDPSGRNSFRTASKNGIIVPFGEWEKNPRL